LIVKGGYSNPRDQGPALVIGTGSKLVDYTYYDWLHLQHAFYHNLFENNDLLVVGYGFRDFGMNQAICSWAQTNHSHRLILIHHDPQTELIKKRVGIEREWFKWDEVNGNIIPKQIEQVSWADVELALSTPPRPFRTLLQLDYPIIQTVHHID